ncbi:hypothetical protein [Marinimicrobium sp. LS-A18]|uniref:hypothetical protein n=1 Tax=Marinimicrobium sp. LS-A18 TaxID=1381596 RepID=UPI00046449D0|nr:hypothetical protein [Marinimicrobium sp. LS-A18]
MCLRPLDDIRALIQAAKQQDLETGQLSRIIQRRADRLHVAIQLPPHQAEAALHDFVVRYVEHVPAFIGAIDALTREAGINDRVAPLLNIACDYFLSPPDLVSGRSHLVALLDEAYLAHRLLEEVNDRFIGSCGIPLAPMDTTRANVIAHELIGEPFANELDQAVLFSAELLLNEYPFEGDNFNAYIAQHRDRGWSEELRRWPCLAANLDIGLRLNA